MEQKFRGFSPDAYRFFAELAFNNNREFFEANRERYRLEVKEPLTDLANDLLPTALSIDPAFNPRLTTIVSRIHRDTRFSKDKSPYRDHAWLSFRRPDTRISESFCIYYEMTPEGYGYGMGMWENEPAMMNAIRARILAAPTRFLEEANALLADGAEVVGESYRKNRFPNASEALLPYLNRKGMTFCFRFPTVKPTFEPSLVPELKNAFLKMGRLYRFLFLEN